MELEEYKKQYAPETDAVPGWDVIDVTLNAVYNGLEPMHWGTITKFMEGGPDPLDGVSAYPSSAGGVDHLHFCSYGFTALYYDEEALGEEHSGFGFELTFRLKSMLSPEKEPVWVVDLMQNIARYIFESGKWFEPYHCLPTNGPIYVDTDTDIVGVIFIADPELPAQSSPHGQVEFLQMFGVTESELETVMSGAKSAEEFIAEHKKTNPLLVTDLERK